MTMRAYRLLFAICLALTPACGQSNESAGGAEGASDPAETGGSSSGAMGESSRAGSAARTGVAGQASVTLGGSSGFFASAGSFSAAGPGGVAGTAPETWNSAKSAALSESTLQAEYDGWKQARTKTCPNGSAIVVSDGTVASKSIGYGMLLSAAMADQPLFVGLWKYYQDHFDKNGLMNARTGECDPPGNNDTNAASDADLDATMALVQAATHWPSANYAAQARQLAAKITQFESEMCDGRRILRPGDAFGGCSDPSDPRINPSYFAPGYYQVFAHYFSEQAATWIALRDGSYQLYAIYQARTQKLVPDWSAPDGGDNGSQYGDDACRTPWRVAVDYAWTGDSRAKAFIENVSSWVDHNGGLPVAAQRQNSAFVGAFALSGAYDQGKFDGYLIQWLDAKLDDASDYPGTLRVVYLLVAAGKFSSTL